MRTFTAVLSLAIATVARAQASEPYYNETSAPFNLVIKSEDGSIDTTSSACHVGAALESFCLSDSNTTSKPDPIAASVFYFNTSVWSQEPAPGLGKPGILTWFLPISGLSPVPSSAYFDYDPTTDLALPILAPGSERPQILAFDSNDQLTVQGYVYDSDSPSSAGEWKDYYRWYACKANFASYRYENLAWGLGPNTPENPTCIAVNVTRKFV